jgi:hypothetical protein
LGAKTRHIGSPAHSSPHPGALLQFIIPFGTQLAFLDQDQELLVTVEYKTVRSQNAQGTRVFL